MRLLGLCIHSLIFPCGSVSVGTMLVPIERLFYDSECQKTNKLIRNLGSLLNYEYYVINDDRVGITCGLNMNLSFENPCPGQANGLPAYYFTQAVQMLIATHCTLGNPDDYPKDFGNSIKNHDQFDFVIVGGGSSGSVIANRLSEMKKWKILLLESGGDPTFESEIPSFSLSLPGRELDWKFGTNQTGDSCLGMEEETCAIFQGKVLGGTSTINKMHYFRGTPDDYDEWEKMGNAGWGYEEVLKYFKKSEKLDEDFKIVSDANYDELFEEVKKSGRGSDKKLYDLSKIAAGKYHSKAGLLSVNHYAYDFLLSDIKKLLFAAAEEISTPHVGDINRKAQIGFVRALATIHEGNRGNAAKAFLTPVKNRQNLYVLRNATVHQLTSDGGRITGVRFERAGEILTVSARKEVILSAGAINSPRLLLLSGIGPKRYLQKMGIDVVKDLKGVGENLQTHLTFVGLPVALKGISRSLSHLQKIDAMYHFISRGIGFFGNVGLNDVVGFISTRNETVPDVEILSYLNLVRDYYTFNELLISLRVKNKIRDQYSKAYAKSGVLLICPTLLRPNSRGRVELSGRDFKDPPKIYPNFLSDEEDIRSLIKGIRFAMRLTQTKAFEKVEPEIIKLDVEGCRKWAFDTNEHWECLVRHLATSMHDAAGTCKMGPEEDPFAVVDDRLRVHGVKGLRVADSSIMPSIVRGSTSVASVMIGERVGDLIKDEWGKAKHEEL